MFDAIIISDLHLGSEACQAHKLDQFLQNIKQEEIKTKKLIINGDFFDSFDLRRLKKSHWKILGDIRKLSDKVTVIWNVGNHDGPADIISQLLGIQVKTEYEFVSGTKKILAIHGDIFDTFITDHPYITYIADVFYYLLQKFDPSLNTARAAKKASKTFLRNAQIVKSKALIYANKKGCDIICTGHTHNEESDYDYYNSGCWTDAVCSYLSVSNGIVNLNHFEKKPKIKPPTVPSRSLP